MRKLIGATLLAVSGPGAVMTATAQLVDPAAPVAEPSAAPTAEASDVQASESAGEAAPAATEAQPEASSASAVSSGRASGIEEIVVTARKVEENVQQVPTAITALGPQAIADMQISGFQNLNGAAPNVYIQKQAGSPSAPQFNIRGISTGNLNVQNDNGIGLYVDGVYLGRPAASGFDIADLERIEVLRGPQGTLFGRNATGGAINIITASPTGRFGVDAEVGSGNYGTRRQKMSVNLPAIADLSIKITGAHSEHDGYVRNTFSPVTYRFTSPFSGDMGTYTTSKEFADNDTDNILVAMTYDGIDRLRLDYKYDFTSFEGTMDGRQNLTLDPTFQFFTNYGEQVNYGGTAVTSLDRLKEYPSNFDSPSTLRVQGHSFTAAYDVTDAVAVKYIGGYREYQQRVGANNLGGNAFVDVPPPPGCTPAIGCNLNGTLQPYVILGALRNEGQHQVSHELQLLGKWEQFDGVVGLFYFNEGAAIDNPVFFSRTLSLTSANTLTLADYFSGQAVKVENESTAAFAHGTYHLNEHWDFSGGLRYTKDNRSEKVLGNASVANYVFSGGATGYASGTTFDYEGNKTAYDASVTYKFTDDINVYVKSANGFVSGGVISGVQFRPETIESYEAGYKSELFDRHLRLNAAVFHQKREAIQVLGFTTANGAFIFDGGEEKSTGIELEGILIPTEGLTLSSSFGYSNIKNDSGVRTYQPKYTASFGAQYEFLPLANGAMPMFRVDAAYRSDANRLPCLAGIAQDPVTGCAVKPSDAPNPAVDKDLVLKSVIDISARLTLSEIPLSEDVHGKISLWGRNLLNNDQYEFLFPAIGQQALGTFQNPRTYGLDLSFNF